MKTLQHVTEGIIQGHDQRFIYEPGYNTLGTGDWEVIRRDLSGTETMIVLSGPALTKNKATAICLILNSDDNF